MAEIRLDNIHKTYGSGPAAVEALDLLIEDGEFLTLLGPSGCGKSTTLRMLAGLEQPSWGELYFDGMPVSKVGPAERNIAMVFQNYALYPHLTVRGNLEYPLRKRRMPKGERRATVDRVASVLHLEPYMDRKPRQLSGGQQQRVALGRAMIRDPSVFLFDEPLSNLDAQLRQAMRAEIVRLHGDIGRTMVFVTHDQLEAMTMSDRIAIMKDGRLQQLGTPAEIYARPANRFVAGFIGTPPMNLLPGAIEDAQIVSGDLRLPNASNAREGAMIELGFRPEHIRLGEGPGRARVTMVEHIGHESLVTLRSAEGEFIARAAAGIALDPGQDCAFGVMADQLHVFDAETGLHL